MGVAGEGLGRITVFEIIIYNKKNIIVVGENFQFFPLKTPITILKVTNVEGKVSIN